MLAHRWHGYFKFVWKLDFSLIIGSEMLYYTQIYTQNHRETQQRGKGKQNHRIWGLETSIYHRICSHFQEISEIFTVIKNRWSNNLRFFHLPDIFWTKRHRIRAFHIHPGRTWKSEQKILSLKKVRSIWKNRKKTVFFPRNVTVVGMQPLTSSSREPVKLSFFDNLTRFWAIKRSHPWQGPRKVGIAEALFQNHVFSFFPVFW